MYRGNCPKLLFTRELYFFKFRGIAFKNRGNPWFLVPSETYVNFISYLQLPAESKHKRITTLSGICQLWTFYRNWLLEE